MEIKFTILEIINFFITGVLVVYIIYRDYNYTKDVERLKDLAKDFNGYAEETLQMQKRTSKKLKDAVDRMEERYSQPSKMPTDIHVVTGTAEEAEEILKIMFGKDKEFRIPTDRVTQKDIDNKIVEEIDKLNYDQFIDYLDNQQLKGVKLCRRILAEHNRNELVSVVDGYIKNREKNN